MEVAERRIDFNELAEEIFWKAIELAGGLGKLVEYRNLTWLPSLATASFVITMHEEGYLDKAKIAERLGITPETVDRILKAKADSVEEVLEGSDREHKAGALARLAYEAIKKEGHGVKLSGSEVSSLGEFLEDSIWAIAVLKAIKGLKFPPEKEELKRRLSGIKVHGKDAAELVEGISPGSPAELLRKFKELSAN